MQTLLQDVRYGLKLLLKDRGFSIAALVTLALCIGANTTILSVVDSILLRPLPFPESERVVGLYNSYPNAGAHRGQNGIPDYFDRMRETSAFEQLAMYRDNGVTVGERGKPERVEAEEVTPSYFRLLRVPAYRGRTFSDDEGEPGNEKKAVLSYGFWQQAFGGRDVIGQDIRVDGEPFIIVGIMPRGFQFEDSQTRLWIPAAFTDGMKSDEARHSNSWEMIGRLKPGVTAQQAQMQIDALNHRNDERFPQFREILQKAGFRTVVTPYLADLTRDVRRTLVLLQIGVLLVLLIGCVNIANLMLIRSTARTRELATRSALGANRIRLVRQLLTESVVLAVIGGFLGVAVGFAGVQLFSATGASELPRGGEIRTNGTVLIATMLLSLVAGLTFGCIPVIRALRANLSSVFRDEGRTGTAGRSTLALRGALVVSQVALAFSLLIGAGLMITSFVKTIGVDPGFDARGVLTASVSLPVTGYPDEAARLQFHRRALERVRAIPGVRAAGATTSSPFGDDFSSSVFFPEGHVPEPGESILSPLQARISSGYFESMRIPLVRGRTFTDSDAGGALPVTIIDEWLANRYWKGEDPIGRRMCSCVPGVTGGPSEEYFTIVGVVKSVRMRGLTNDQTPGRYYFPMEQDAPSNVFLTLSTTLDPASLTGSLQTAITQLDPDLPVYAVKTMQARIADSLTTERVRLMLLVSFSALALVLASVGIYGVLAYSVAQRTTEIGVRMALGSSARDIFKLVLARGMQLMAIGLLLGLGASLLLTRFLESMLYGVEPVDIPVFGAVLGVLAVVATVACVIPARRAMRVDPVVAIRM
jgi:predicted permease